MIHRQGKQPRTQAPPSQPGHTPQKSVLARHRAADLLTEPATQLTGIEKDHCMS